MQTRCILQGRWGMSLLAAAPAVLLFLARSPASAAAEPAESGWAWWLFFGRLHAPTLHLPIGFFVIAIFLDVYSMVRRSADLRRAAYLVMLLTALSAMIAALAGWLLASCGCYDPRALAIHRWSGVLMAVLAAVTAYVQRAGLRREKALVSRFLSRFLMVVIVAVLAVAGHSGGDLTHGAGFLTRHAPELIKSWLGELGGETESDARAADGARETFFVEKVLPILEGKCFECHNAVRCRGDYRMDTREAALSAGESGLAAIVPGEPMQSHLVRLILLPADRGHVLHPRIKEPLTAEEVLSIVHWIHDGAVFVEAESTARPERAVPAGEAQAADPPDEDSGPADDAEKAGAREARSSTFLVPEGPIDFVRDVQGILEEHCVRCHGERKGKGEYRLHTREKAVQAGDFMGPGITPGEPGKSSLYTTMIIPPDEDVDEMLMPPAADGGPLPPEALEIIRRWILEGAAWPEGVVLREE